MANYVVVYKDGAQDAIVADGLRIDSEDYILVQADPSDFVWASPRENVRSVKRLPDEA